jgi:uncharacterized membrane protein
MSILIAYEKTFSSITLFKESWEIFKQNKTFYIKNVLVFGLIALIADGLAEDKSMKLIDIVLQIINLIASWYGTYVLIKGSLSLIDHKPIGEDVYDITPGTVMSLLGASFLVMLGVIVGTVLLIIPGIIVALRTQFANYIVIDTGMHALPAVKKSFALTKGYFWSLVRLFMVFILLAIISVFPFLGFGFIITMPLFVITMARVYRIVSSEQSSIVETVQA